MLVNVMLMLVVLINFLTFRKKGFTPNAEVLFV